MKPCNKTQTEIRAVSSPPSQEGINASCLAEVTLNDQSDWIETQRLLFGEPKGYQRQLLGRSHTDRSKCLNWNTVFSFWWAKTLLKPAAWPKSHLTIKVSELKQCTYLLSQLLDQSYTEQSKRLNCNTAFICFASCLTKVTLNNQNDWIETKRCLSS